jgi:hypothetical protein
MCIHPKVSKEENNITKVNAKYSLWNKHLKNKSRLFFFVNHHLFANNYHHCNG